MAMKDVAQAIELQQWELNNASRPAPLKYAPDDEGYGPEECEECGAAMPVQRREHGFTICVGCKSAQEEAARKRRR